MNHKVSQPAWAPSAPVPYYGSIVNGLQPKWRGAVSATDFSQTPKRGNR